MKIMKNIYQKGKVVVINRIFYFCLFLASFHVQGSQTLNILNWDDYISESVIQAWEEKTGAKVRIVTYDDEIIRDALLTDSRQNQIDLAIVDSQSANKLAELNYLARLDDVSSDRTVESRWIKQCGNFATPYLWGTFGIAYRTDKVTSPVTSWKDLFSSRSDISGHIGMLNDFYAFTAPALLALNLPHNTHSEGDLKQAYELLKKQVQDVVTYEYAPSYLLNPNNKDSLYAAAVYSGDQYTMDELVGSEVWDYVLPEEGSFVWLDCWVIPIQSGKKRLAKSFLSFIGRPDIAAENSEELGVATVSRAAYELQSEEFRMDELTYPPKDVFSRLLPFEPLPEFNVRQRTRMFEAVKVIHESK